MKNLKKMLYIVIVILFASCSKRPELYKSQCDKDNTYYKIELSELVANVQRYDGKYVEIEGEYKSEIEESALYKSGLFDRKDPELGLWVEFDVFIIKCPLLSATGANLFGKEEKFKNMFNKTITLHGRIDMKRKGHLSQYKASLQDVTMVMIE